MKNRVKQLRQSLSMTQSEFATKIAMNQTGISMVEKGTRDLTDRQIITICAVFGVDEAWLRTGEGDMYPLPAEEDTELIELIGALAADDIDSRKKRTVASLAKLILELPDESLDAFQSFFNAMADGLQNKKDED